MLPEAFLERLEKIVPAEEFDYVLNSFEKTRPTTFRTNTLKISSEDLKKQLDNLDIIYKTVNWYKDAFILVSPSKKEFMETDLYKNGMVYVQSLSSMIPPLILDPKQHEKVCDLTAAPGSKTTQMAMMMKNTGEIVANDKSRVRLYKLIANLKMQGVANAKVTSLPGQILWRNYPEYFDKTLVDVPCSMEGRFCTLDEKSYRDWSLKKVKELVSMQRFLLRAGVSATKVGGLIVYSTCTLAPEENEGVVNWILEKEKGAVEVETVSISLPNTQSGIVEWNGKAFDPSLKYALRILPSETMEGFFVALLRKTKPTVLPLDIG